MVFIDYLGGMQSECDEPGDYFKFLHIHKLLVEKGLSEFADDGRILAKYLWLKKYHNAVILTRLSDEFHSEFRIGDPETGPEIPLLRQVATPNRDREKWDV